MYLTMYFKRLIYHENINETCFQNEVEYIEHAYLHLQKEFIDLQRAYQLLQARLIPLNTGKGLTPSN